MKTDNFTGIVLMLAIMFSTNGTKAQVSNQPNVIFILVDDEGYGDIGVFFQNQRRKADDKSRPYELTPHLDEMANTGVRFTHQYCNAPVCAPSRASFLTGVNQGNSEVRNNQFDKAIEDNYTIGRVMQTAGYCTVAVGKWGLQGVKEDGPQWPAHPLKRGFDNFYGYMRHADGHEHYPFEGLYDGKKQVWDNYSNVADGLNKCYTTDLWTAYAKKWISNHVQGSKGSQPFFMYLAYDCPHAVLELPAQPYPQGGGVKGGMQWLGKPTHMINTADGIIDSYIYPEYAHATYDDDREPSTAEKAWPETFKRYATATRRIDDAVGDIRQLLAELKITDNTIVVFTSDNGPSIESYLPAPNVPNQPNFFGSYGPFDGIKRDCWEGGLRVPTIACWPGHILQGKTITTPSMLSDWMATFADAAHISVPARTDGVSLMPDLTDHGKQQQPIVYSEYFEPGVTPDFQQFEASRRGRKRDQMQMIRQGNIVGVRYQIKTSDDDFELYDVVNDPKETRNLAVLPGYVAIQAQMKAKVLQLRRADKDAPRPYDNTAIPGSETTRDLKPGLQWYSYKGAFPWVPSIANLAARKTGVTATIPLKKNNPERLVCFKGYVKVPADGIYKFSLQTTGKAYLRIHEATLIDADYGYKSDTALSQTINLKAGFHSLTLNYLIAVTGKRTLYFSLLSPKGIPIPLNGQNLFH